MKTIKFFSVAIVAIALASCGGNKQSNGLTEGASATWKPTNRAT